MKLVVIFIYERDNLGAIITIRPLADGKLLHTVDLYKKDNDEYYYTLLYKEDSVETFYKILKIFKKHLTNILWVF